MSKVGEAVMSYVSSTSKVWMYCLTLLTGITGALLAIELYHERTLYQGFRDDNWTTMATWGIIFSFILIFEAIITCVCVCLDKNKIIKRYITAMNLVNVVAIVVLLMWLPNSAEVKRHSKFTLGEAMKSYSFFQLPTPSGAQYLNGPQTVSVYPMRLVQTAGQTVPPPPPPGMIVPEGIRDPRYASTQLWDYLQNYYKCCGVEDEKDWLDFSSQHKYYPRSCCSPFSVEFSLDNSPVCKEVDTGRKKYGCLKPIKTLHLVSLVTFIVALLLSLLLAAVAYVQGIRYEEYAK